MSPAAGMMLLHQIVPLIASAVARSKVVTPGNIAYYTVQALRTGRRSVYTGRRDALSPAAAMDRNATFKSMDEVIGPDPDDASLDITLHDLLADKGESADRTAGRNLDWECVQTRLDARRRAVLRETAARLWSQGDRGPLRRLRPPRGSPQARYRRLRAGNLGWRSGGGLHGRFKVAAPCTGRHRTARMPDSQVRVTLPHGKYTPLIQFRDPEP